VICLHYLVILFLDYRQYFFKMWSHKFVFKDHSWIKDFYFRTTIRRILAYR